MRRSLSSVSKFPPLPIHGERSPTPLVENYANSWPAPLPSAAYPTALAAPVRTIPDSKLRFQTKSTFATGGSIYYPHLKFHPADFKVAVVVALADLQLSHIEQDIFIEMVGPRFNQGKRLVRLTADRFSNRIENKKYLIYVLEKLLLESKRIAKIAHTFD